MLLIEDYALDIVVGLDIAAAEDIGSHKLAVVLAVETQQVVGGIAVGL